MVDAGTGEALRDRAEAAGQGHLFRFWDELDESGRRRLLEAVGGIDFARTGEMAELARNPPEHVALSFAPPDPFPLERDAARESEAAQARERGADLLRSGRLGYVVVAGGQGSRLGFDGPKGTFALGPVSGRTLFGWHAARLLAAGARYGVGTTWYVMTSAANHEATLRHFEEQDWYGLGREDVFVFQQRMLPAFDAQGRILLAGRDAPFLAPNGHGGTLDGLRASGALEHAEQRGIQVFSYFQVDNPLSRPADPLFLGLHDAAGEKVGVLGHVDGRFGCIEYSDLPDDLRHATDAGGRLLFRAGNIACHLIDRAFVERLTAGGELRLPWHLARKRIAAIDEGGAPVEREGIKFETFVFDALGEARASVTLETERALEFSPVKNGEGSDSPATSRADLSAMFSGWIRDVGGTPAVRVEIDPRLAEDVGELRARWPVEPRTIDGGHLYEP